jgi:hypothetical protein
MSIRKIMPEIFLTALLAFVSSLVVSYLYGVLKTGAGTLEWESSIRLGIILGVTLPLVRHFDGKKGS